MAKPDRAKQKKDVKKDPQALLLRGAIAILVLAALAVILNVLQQVLWPQSTPTPGAELPLQPVLTWSQMLLTMVQLFGVAA